MAESVVNNRQIAKNTIFLYIRMIVVMLIQLYTVRAYLSILGETDYGLYNVIGGVVAMFSFLNQTLATSSQRYFSQALVRKDKAATNRVFCLNLTIYLFLIAFVVIILETAGLWFVNNKMTIPAERMKAANVVYQLSIITFALQFLTISFNAIVISHEKMKTFAFVGILEAFLKLGFVFVLMNLPFDKLISYAVFLFLMHLLVMGIYITYCRRNFEESRYHFYWNKKEALEMLGFSGWHLLGTLSMVARSSGVNILINMFFNPAVNAARAVAFQVEGAIHQLSNNFFVAVKPQMYKSYSNGEIDSLNNLVLRSTIICFFLVSLLSIPIFFNAEYILGLWLKDVPQYAIAFTQLVLINGLIDSIQGSLIVPALATGKIKVFYLVSGTLIILTLPIAYILLRLGFEPTSTMYVSIAISIVVIIARAIILVGLVHLPLKKYFMLWGRLLLSTIIIGVITFYTVKLISNLFMALVVSTVVSSILHCVIYLGFVCTKQDRVTIIGMAKEKMHIKSRK